MLFNSYTFILLFLPIVVSVFFLLATRLSRHLAIAWLVSSSLFFYAWWNPTYLVLIGTSIGINFLLATLAVAPASGHRSRPWLWLGILFNLSLLGYFKYANFLVDNVNAITGAGINLPSIVLPLAISFFTFQQITFLVDSYRGIARETSFLKYCLFVTFFPQLIAGPIVHHREIRPQMDTERFFRLSGENISVGLTIFVIGLSKKVLIADSIEPAAAPVFAAADQGLSIDILTAWMAFFANSFHWYFDFSGYSDMALGLARLFGIRLPLNFYSPLKSLSITDLFRRWHMTLARFLRDYVYIPLGGSRGSRARTLCNLFATMFICGVWHGASWNFLAWGSLCGIMLIVNQLWRRARQRYWPDNASTIVSRRVSHAATFLGWTASLVFLGSGTIDGSMHFFLSLAGLADHGTTIADSLINDKTTTALMLFGISVIAFCAPNTVQLMARYKPALEERDGYITSGSGLMSWKPTTFWAIYCSLLFVLCLGYLVRVREFIYFQF